MSSKVSYCIDYIRKGEVITSQISESKVPSADIRYDSFIIREIVSPKQFNKNPQDYRITSIKTDYIDGWRITSISRIRIINDEET